MRWPLRFQIMVPMTAVVMGAIVGLSAANAYLAAQEVRRQITERIAGVAETLVRSPFPMTSAILLQMKGLAGADLVLLGSDGQIVATTRSDWGPTLVDQVKVAAGPAELRLGLPVELGGHQFYHAAVAVAPVAPADAERTLHVFYSEDDYRARRQQVILPPVLIGCGACLLVVGLALATAAHVSRPLGRLRQQVAAMAEGRFEPIAVPTREDEVRELIVAVNQMAERLVDYERQIRRTERVRTLAQLSGGLVHQLRNSATGARMALDLHRDECQVEAADESLEVARRQVVLMEKYLQKFLALGTQRPQVRSNPRAAVARGNRPWPSPCGGLTPPDSAWWSRTTGRVRRRSRQPGSNRWSPPRKMAWDWDWLWSARQWTITAEAWAGNDRRDGPDFSSSFPCTRKERTVATLLIVDDEQAICWALERLGRQMGHEVLTCPSAEQALELVQRQIPDVVVLDIRLPGMDGLTAITHLRAHIGAVPIIVITAFSDASVLLQGESGTGKELAARAIHKFSARTDQPFVVVNVAALSSTLAESELFGHVRGAFTGAEQSRPGLLVQAGGGTLFLDEIAEIPLVTQVKLLRALENGEVIPVGSDQPVRTNFRVISATHRDLLEAVRQSRFRHDLYFRISTFRITLAPLRQRRGDIVPLSRYFLDTLVPAGAESGGLSDEVCRELEHRDWYGNVRELRNAIQHALIVARGTTILPAHLPARLPASVVADAAEPERLETQIAAVLEQWTRQQLENPDQAGQLYEQLLRLVEPPVLRTVFESQAGQFAASARILGLHRTTFRRKADQYGLV